MYMISDLQGVERPISRLCNSPLVDSIHVQGFIQDFLVGGGGGEVRGASM